MGHHEVPFNCALYQPEQKKVEFQPFRVEGRPPRKRTDVEPVPRERSAYERGSQFLPRPLAQAVPLM